MITQADWVQIGATAGPVIAMLAKVLANQTATRGGVRNLEAKLDGHIKSAEERFFRLEGLMMDNKAAGTERPADKATQPTLAADGKSWTAQEKGRPK